MAGEERNGLGLRGYLFIFIYLFIYLILFHVCLAFDRSNGESVTSGNRVKRIMYLVQNFNLVWDT